MSTAVRGVLMTSAEQGAAGLGGAQARPIRADARRNRLRLLEAAEEIFAKEGLAVPVDEVAKRAGVGVGTLYRHFPTKEDLFEAIVLRHMDDLAAVCEHAHADRPVEAFFEFLARLAEQVSLKHDLFDALGESAADFKTRCGPKIEALECAVDALRQRAVEAGGVRPDVTTQQIIGLVVSACKVSAHGVPGGDGSRCQLLDVVFDGLRATHGRA